VQIDHGAQQEHLRSAARAGVAIDTAAERHMTESDWNKSLAETVIASRSEREHTKVRYVVAERSESTRNRLRKIVQTEPHFFAHRWQG